MAKALIILHSWHGYRDLETPQPSTHACYIFFKSTWSPLPGIHTQLLLRCCSYVCLCYLLFAYGEATDRTGHRQCSSQSSKIQTAFCLMWMALCVGQCLFNDNWTRTGKGVTVEFRGNGKSVKQWSQFSSFLTLSFTSLFLCYKWNSISQLTDSPTTARVAKWPVVPHIFDTGPIWQQTICAGR